MAKRGELPAIPGTESPDVKTRFNAGAFPVVTVDALDGAREVDQVLGLVVSRGYSAEDVFFTMLQRAVLRGAHGLIGYRENVSFHPDGSRYYICYGTAVTIRG